MVDQTEGDLIHKATPAAIKAGDQNGFIYKAQAAALVGWTVQDINYYERNHGKVPGHVRTDNVVMYPHEAFVAWHRDMRKKKRRKGT